MIQQLNSKIEEEGQMQKNDEEGSDEEESEEEGSEEEGSEEEGSDEEGSDEDSSEEESSEEDSSEEEGNEEKSSKDVSDKVDVSKEKNDGKEKVNDDVLEKEVKTEANLKRKQTDETDVKAKKSKTDNDEHMVSERDSRTLFCKNIPFTSDEDEVAGVFEGVKDVRFLQKRAGRSRGVGFIEFNSKEEKEAAFAMNGEVKLKGRTLLLSQTSGIKPAGASNPVVQNSKPKKKKAQDQHQHKRTLFVKGIPLGMTEKAILSSFKRAIDVKIPVRSEKSKPFAHVEFATESEAMACYAKVKNGIVIDGVTLMVELAAVKSSVEDRHLRTLFIRGVTKNMTVSSISSKFDRAIDVRIPKDSQTGINKHFAFVEFATESEAKTCCESVKNGVDVDGVTLKVQFASGRNSS